MMKSELRKIYLDERRSLSSFELGKCASEISEIFFASFDLSDVKYLHCFIPTEKFNEVDTASIFEKVWRDFPQITTVIPRVNFQTGDLENIVFHAGTELVENAWGFNEAASVETAEATKIDIVLVPLLCFDELGNRVGYGKGFYDRLLGRCRPDCRKVGLSYFPPVDRIDDVAGHDVPLDYCVTPTEIFSFA